MDLLRGPLPPGNEAPGDDEEGQALEMAMAQAMLRRVSRGDSGAVLRVYRPSGPAVAFGRRDVRLAGFPDAVAAVRRAGFSPCVRAPGGRAVAYTPEALVVDHVSPDPEWPSGLEGRFAEFGELWVDVLQALGVDARVGEVPGEYCPGSHSVNARGVVKLVGTAQRMVRGAWLFSSVLVFDGASVLRPLLDEVYGRLEQPFDVASVGSLAEEVPELSLDTVEDAVLAAYDERFGLSAADLSEGLVAEAATFLPDHKA
ncbi:MAG TPA: lipoate--protein ligase family protein [Nocardioidaceae bacterium]|nr:lipoate--protein ligase family protein [Nocardioidaceae bacterium]